MNKMAILLLKSTDLTQGKTVPLCVSYVHVHVQCIMSNVCMSHHKF